MWHTTVEAPDAVAAEWAALADRSAADPFAHPDWWLPWGASFAEERLAVVTVRDGAVLRALAPVLVDGDTVRLAQNDHVPWVGVLADDAAAADVLVAGLLGMRQPALRVGPTALDGPLASAVRRAAAQARCRTLERPVRYSPYAEPSRAADISELLDTGFRRDLRRRRRRLEEQGRVEVTVHRGGADLAERLDEAFAVELRQWKGAERTAIASRPETLAFYTDVAEAASRRGDLELTVLRLDGRAISFTLVLRHHKALYGLKTAYDPEYARFSPGQLLQREVFADAQRRGIDRYEFLGQADPYKLRWTSGRHELGTVVVYARTSAGTAAYVTHRYLRPAAARVRDRLAAARSRITRPTR
ncbi:GNAT family N-acetyltransferase [Pseudonocardia sp.]|uniref:GNAT family N-acetyltransferase n=1 Tax=Pseudonocardia sp. TaxID=60912 RepID=UPI00262AC3B9|nr:GNAT family N-acetyltransferase [Pseudonocardia sp.]